MAGVKRRKPKIIQDKKKRGEWAESVFLARAAEHGLPVGKPWGEMCSYDFIVGKTGRFVSVQVKSTICPIDTGYDCTVRGGHKSYPAGAFDFLAAYVVVEDSWYIIPASVIHGKRAIVLNPNLPTAKYEKYREAWHLLREAAQLGEQAESASTPAETESCADGPANEPAAREPAPCALPATAMGRMQASMRFFRRSLERGTVNSDKGGSER